MWFIEAKLYDPNLILTRCGRVTGGVDTEVIFLPISPGAEPSTAKQTGAPCGSARTDEEMELDLQSARPFSIAPTLH
jgi:hypothetical protein